MNDLQKLGTFIADKVNRIGALSNLQNSLSGGNSGSNSGGNSSSLPSDLTVTFQVDAPYNGSTYPLSHISTGEGQTYNSFSATDEGGNAVPFSCTSYNTTQMAVYHLTFSRSASVANITIRSALSGHDTLASLDVSSVWSSWQQAESITIRNSGNTFVVPSV